MRAFILAGGFATRLWPLTEKRAKPLLPVAGRPILSRLVEKIPGGVAVTISTNKVFSVDFSQWKEEVRNAKCELHVVIEDVDHEDEKLGALGALAQWIETERIDDDVLLLAGDNIIGFSLASFLERFQGEPLLAVVDVRDPERAKQLGTVIVLGDTVKAFEEKPRYPKSTLVSTGCAVLPRYLLPEVRAFARLKPDNIGGLFEHFLTQGITVRRMSFLEPWFDIGSFQAYLEATKAIVGDRTIKAKGASLDVSTKRRGSLVIGRGSHVTGSRLHDVVIFDRCTIEDCVLQDCVIDEHCELHGVDLSGKMIRAGTRLLR